VVWRTRRSADIEHTAARLATCGFGDEQGRMNCSIVDAGGALVVSQFTLLADVRRGGVPFR
jgi:D-Tyr-tRNAtyr deacylase